MRLGPHSVISVPPPFSPQITQPLASVGRALSVSVFANRYGYGEQSEASGFSYVGNVSEGPTLSQGWRSQKREEGMYSSHSGFLTHFQSKLRSSGSISTKI